MHNGLKPWGSLTAINFLDDIIESVEYEDNIDHKNYLYVGIEVGSPTVDDIGR